MTERLYYKDSKYIEFKAKILKTYQTEEGVEIMLDRTAFYPTSGGQPYDTGTIDGFTVTDVWEDGQDIWHRVKGKPESEEVSGIVDWNRRFDHMQQHSGQHLLSSIFYQLLNTNTIGFHIGSKQNTIDLDTKSLEISQIHMIENQANRLIWEDHPVQTFFVESSQISEFAFRKTPKITGAIRVVKIGDSDVSACGGTHVYSTGEIGIIKIANAEKYKGGVRLSFLCGKRCLHQVQQIWEIVNSISTDLSINQDNLIETVERMKDELRKKNREIKKLKINLLSYEAENIWNKTEVDKGVKRILISFENRPIGDLRLLAEQFRKLPNTFAILIGTYSNASRIICTKNPNLKGINSAQILNELIDPLGGKSGGSEILAEGGMPLIDPTIVMKTNSILDRICSSL